ncbi:MAG: HAMP domain-containing sensor histidine kinase [Candidatus Omnitrophota bacterium]|nr:HAMP domain-containing sensor histidine kinase [Candidatus Omnitrophota bacterium]
MTRKFPVIILSLALLVIIGYVDYKIDPTLSLLIFYLIPVFIAAWFAGTFAAVFMLVLSLVAWVTDVCRFFGVCTLPAVPYWDISLDFILCGVFIYGIRLIKILLEKIRVKNKQLQELDERKSAFVSHVSHEFKNPLFVIKEALDLVMEEKGSSLSDKQKELLGYAMKDTKRLTRLVTDLLDLARIESGHVELKKEKIDIASLADEIIDSRRPEYSKKNIVIIKHMDQNAGFVYADSDKLTEVIINILDNAIKYSPNGSEITIHLRGNADEIYFEISDKGPGITKENCEKVFDKFERIITGNQEGTGLGLAIAKDIINLHNGKIWVESVPGSGSKFIFTLPRGRQ